MVNRVVCVVLLALLAAIHAQLWLGHGSMAYVRELQGQIKDQPITAQGVQVGATVPASGVPSAKGW